MSADNSVVENPESIYRRQRKIEQRFEKFGVGLLTTLTLAVMSAASPQSMGKFRTLQWLLDRNCPYQFSRTPS
jgi:hypothetical protein